MIFRLNIFFYKCFKSNKNIRDMIFLLKRVKPNIFCKVIDKDNIVFEIIKQMNNRDLYIKKKKLFQKVEKRLKK